MQTMTTDQQKVFLDEISSKIEKLPVDQQVLLSSAIGNILNGSYWGFIPSSLVKKLGDPTALKSDLFNIYKIVGNMEKPQYLLEAKDPKVVLKVLQQVAPMLVDNDTVQSFLKKHEEAKQGFEKWVSGLKSDNPNGVTRSVVGLNSMNSTHTMTYMNKKQKAFQLRLQDVILMLQANKRTQALIYVEGSQPVDVLNINSVEKLQEVYKTCSVSEGSNSLVLKLITRKVSN